MKIEDLKDYNEIAFEEYSIERLKKDIEICQRHKEAAIECGASSKIANKYAHLIHVDETCIEALNYRIPRPVQIFEYSNSRIEYRCASCNLFFKHYAEIKYCPSCGQRILWSKFKEGQNL